VVLKETPPQSIAEILAVQLLGDIGQRVQMLLELALWD